MLFSPVSSNPASKKMGAGKDIRIVVCGQRGCGKTSILELLVHGYLSQQRNLKPTVEDIYCAQIYQHGGISERLRIFDTAGLDDNCREIPRHLLCFADAYVIVYSVTSEKSFRYMEDIKKDIDRNKEKKDAIIIVLGNKVDLAQKREIDATVAQIWAASEKVKLWEVTTMERLSLFEPFFYIASKANPPQPRQGFPNLKKTIGKIKE